MTEYDSIEKYERLTGLFRSFLNSPEFQKKYGAAELERMNAWAEDTRAFFSFMRKERKGVSQKLKDAVSESYREAQQITALPELKSWYKAQLEQVEDREHRRELETIYRGRLIEFIVSKYDLQNEIEAQKAKRIKNAKDLEEILKTTPETEEIVRLCSTDGKIDDVAVADILAVIYDGKTTRTDLIDFLQKTTLRDYLGKFVKPSGIGDILEAGEGLLPLDKGGVIANRLYNRLIEQRRLELSNTATPEECNAFMEKLNKIMEERWPNG